MKSYPAKIFYCYSHKDEVLRDELEKHLKMLERQNIITNWYDRKIMPGVEWDKEINRKINTADIVLLLISPDFLASDYCYEKEMGTALQLHKEGKLQVIPILLRICDWKNAPFANLQGLPMDMKPIKDKSWYSIDEALYNVAEGLKSNIQELFDNYAKIPNAITPVKHKHPYNKSEIRIKINEKHIGLSQKDQDVIVKIITEFLNLKSPIHFKTIAKTDKIVVFDLPIDLALKLQQAINLNTFKEFKSVEFNYFQREEEEIKDEIFPEKQVRNSVLVFRAINHKLRLSIIKLLKVHEHMTITDIYIKLRLEQGVASQHVAILRRSGVVEMFRKGKFIYYKLNYDRIDKILKAINILK